MFDIILENRGVLFLVNDGGNGVSRIILVTSFKGGVGKTTVSANLAACFAMSGRKVLVCDGDLESRCLDMVLGADNQPLFNICDAVKGTCELSAAVAKTKYGDNLFFMPAPAFYPEALQTTPTDEIFNEESLKKFIGEASANYEYVIFDLPARPDRLYRSLVPLSETVIVVSSHTSVSVRAAEKTAIAVGELCENKRTPELGLVVNTFRPSGAARGENAGLYDIISKTKIPLLGVIPYDRQMAQAQEKGILACDVAGGKTPFWKAVNNIAARLEGVNVKLLEGIRLKVKKSELF